ncbi:hypothetical protein J6590_054274 [Homalodisca vitripennis]|nr:hypothetical protein J6590_054274 [Homalodisca vitripennis]
MLLVVNYGGVESGPNLTGRSPNQEIDFSDRLNEFCVLIVPTYLAAQILMSPARRREPELCSVLTLSDKGAAGRVCRAHSASDYIGSPAWLHF